MNVQEAVADPEWQQFRRSLKGMDTASKLNNLGDYYEQQYHDVVCNIAPSSCRVCVRVDNYLKALARGGQLPAGVSLQQALAWDWNFRILK
jgi:hypothetical protein